MSSPCASTSDYWTYMQYIHSRTSQPLQAQEVPQFLSLLLDKQAIAKTRVIDTKTQKKALVGKYECLQGKWQYRGSNFTERLYVGFQALRQAGYSPKAACITLAQFPAVKAHLGRSRRGRRSNRRVPSLDRRVATIRGLCGRFKSPFKDAVLEMRVGEYRRFQIHQDDVAEYEQVTQRIRKLISEGVCVPYSPIPVLPVSDSSK